MSDFGKVLVSSGHQLYVGAIVVTDLRSGSVIIDYLLTVGKRGARVDDLAFLASELLAAALDDKGSALRLLLGHIDSSRSALPRPVSAPSQSTTSAPPTPERAEVDAVGTSTSAPSDLTRPPSQEPR